MLTIKAIENLEELSELKKQYFEQSTAPLDGMWHFGFVPLCTHFAFYEGDKLVGYCCINDDGYMLQFYLAQEAQTQAKDLFALIAQKNSAVIGSVKGAFLSTAEPFYLALCLDNSNSFKVNALMYHQASSLPPHDKNTIALTRATLEQLPELVEFAAENIGAPVQWLTEYYTNLIKREELFSYRKKGKLLATGECRLFDELQSQYAELGMIVAKSERGHGIATAVLKRLLSLANQRDLTAICSTESSNLAAQKAIYRAGLRPLNRIIQIEFNHD